MINAAKISSDARVMVQYFLGNIIVSENDGFIDRIKREWVEKETPSTDQTDPSHLNCDLFEYIKLVQGYARPSYHGGKRVLGDRHRQTRLLPDQDVKPA